MSNRVIKKVVIVCLFFVGFTSSAYGVTFSLKDKLPYLKGGVYTDEAFTLDLSGYFSLEGFVDTRQVMGFVQDEYAWYPEPVLCDRKCADINDEAQMNMLGVRVYITSLLKGPDIWGAKSSGFIKCDFVGVNDPTVRLYRIRHAFMMLEWERTWLKMGHSYHPLVLNEVYPAQPLVVYPNTITRASGAGYDPFVYNPVIKLNHRRKNWELTCALAKSFRSAHARWAAFPDVFFKAKRHIGRHFFGAGINYNVEVPRLETNKGYKTKQQIGSIIPFFFALFDIHPLVWDFRLTYFQNASPYAVLGAYAVRWRNPATDERIYTNMRTLTFWSELSYRGSKVVQPGCLFGISKNLGASCRIQKYYVEKNIVNGRETEAIVPLLNVDRAITNADYMMIFSPRIRLRFENFTIGIETEYTRAAFARSYDRPGWQHDFDCRGRVVRSTPVSNFRFYGATFYTFA